MVADGGEHAAHLVVTTFMQGQPRMARIDDFEFCRQQRGLLRFQHQRAAGEQLKLVATQITGKRGFVNLRQF